MHGQYANATESAVMYANSLSSLSKAKTILSIGKLASKLISDPAVPVAAARALNKDQGDLSFQQGVQQTLKEMEHNLALIKVQEKLQKMCPRYSTELILLLLLLSTVLSNRYCNSAYSLRTPTPKSV